MGNVNPSKHGKPKGQESNIILEVLEKVAKKEGCNALELPPVYASIEPVALDSLDLQSKIQFEYIGCEIIEKMKQSLLTSSQICRLTDLVYD